MSWAMNTKTAIHTYNVNNILFCLYHRNNCVSFKTTELQINLDMRTLRTYSPIYNKVVFVRVCLDLR